MRSILFLFGMISALALFAQSASLENTLIINENAVHKVTQVEMLGTQEATGVNQLYYSFTHPGGGVQKVKGSFFSGGKEPTSLKAFGVINISQEGVVSSDFVRWLAPRHSGVSINLYANPLDGADAMLQKPIAAKGQVSPYDTLGGLKRQLEEAGEIVSLAVSGKKENDLPLCPQYYESTVYVGLGGGINQILTMDHTLKSEEDRNKLMSMKDYDLETSINKDHVKDVFGADNITFKYSAGAIPQVSDPITGNVIVMGGIRYKKNKAKANSEYKEFRLFTFNKEGEVVNSVNYESDEPILIKGGYPIYGQQLGPDLWEATHAVIIAGGAGNRKMTNINKKYFKAIVVDVKTGEIVAEHEQELSQPAGKFLEARQCSNGTIELLYYYPASGQQSLTLINIGKDGLVNLKEFSKDSPEVQSFKLPANPKIRTINSFELEDGSQLVIKEIYKTVAKEEGSTQKIDVTVSFAAYKYSVNDQLESIRGLGDSFNLNDATLYDKSDDLLSFYEQYKDTETGQDKIRFININTKALEVETLNLDDGYFLVSPDSFIHDQDNRQILFLTQKTAGKGLYCSKYQY